MNHSFMSINDFLDSDYDKISYNISRLHKMYNVLKDIKTISYINSEDFSTRKINGHTTTYQSYDNGNYLEIVTEIETENDILDSLYIINVEVASLKRISDYYRITTVDKCETRRSKDRVSKEYMNMLDIINRLKLDDIMWFLNRNFSDLKKMTKVEQNSILDKAISRGC